ncbi:MAG: tetratricopeptide repeat protein [Ottowia sp.]|nr:tetratricopeptide repeat protein [Ottowia sp.]
MANPLDLEEQEQLAALRHFWNRWGGLISWALIVVLTALTAWNGWQLWQRRQAQAASRLFDEISAAVQAEDLARVERVLADLQKSYGSTTYGAYGGLLAARALEAASRPEQAQAALAWVSGNAPNDGQKALARLRLAAMQLDDKAYDAALKTLDGNWPPQYAALAADRRGDALLLQGKRDDAVREYGRAYQGLTASGDGYSRMVGIKLNALGVDPQGAGAAGGAS